jgi:transposase-like protein
MLAFPRFRGHPHWRDYALGETHGETEAKTFSDEFKADAVKLCKAGGRSVGQVAADLDVTETALREWVKR